MYLLIMEENKRDLNSGLISNWSLNKFANISYTSVDYQAEYRNKVS